MKTRFKIILPVCWLVILVGDKLKINALRIGFKETTIDYVKQ